MSAVLCRLDCLQSGLFISIYQTQMKLEPQVEFAKEASQFQYTFWENHDITVQPANYASCLFFISFLNGPEAELNYKIGVREIYHWYFIIYRQLVLSPFWY
jgi:hypothetical protein